MSFDIFVQAFELGSRRTFSRDAFEDTFASYIVERRDGFVRLKFDDLNYADVYISNSNEIDGFAVSRPPTDARFWDGIVQILHVARAVVYWPDDARNSFFVADLSVAKELPPDMINSLGFPQVARQGSDLVSRLV